MNSEPGGGPSPPGGNLAPYLDDLSRLAERRFASSLGAVAEVLALVARVCGAQAALLVRFDDVGAGLVLAATPGVALAPGDAAPVRLPAGIAGDAPVCVAADGVPARSWMAAPVVLATGAVHAHLCALGDGASPLPPDGRESLRALARLLATQLDRDRELGLRERVEAELRERESRARALVQNAGDLFLILSAEGIVRYASPAAERLLGWTPDELLGRLPPEVGLRDPDDRPAYAAALAAARASGPILPTVTVRMRRKGGDARTFEISRVDRLADPAVRGILAVAHDVTERVAAETRLAAERALLSSLMDNAPDVLYVTDAALRFRRLNPAAARVLGLADPAAAVGRTIAEVAPSPASEATLAAQAAVVATGEPLLNRLEPEPGSDGGRWRLTSLVPLHDGDGAVDGLIGLSRDVTELHRAEAEMAAALAAQRAANAELERLNRVKSDFVAVISHEFRTPLTSIQGFSELIRDVPMPPGDVAECADEVNRAAVRLARMIDRVLDLDRLQRGHARMRMERVDLNEVLAEAVDALRPTTAIHAFRLELDPALPTLEGDRDRLFQVATNLVGNAVKYAPEGGEIVVTSARAGGVARFDIRDEGIGIPEEALEQVFERYARVEAVAGPSIQGTGLGLPIAREIVGQHGGRIWAERNAGRGSTFVVELPIDREAMPVE